ncbi:hypothetical protein PENARI_c031G09583 [Penicillium arizonense]|uniref:Uncharacterized protein n=1 Tax=Penicillium arizonense TaxID=1835702 RepID=A0A1F5L5K1_PENAI|nr:hypothetical protein PENARI_c031G09583 [Penicillium arizonense]OGE48209.1 hypothetical protein PENARI_c031G09583 [Penicillium arizonense]
MRSKPRPATVHDLDASDNPILHTRKSAKIDRKKSSKPSRKQTKQMNEGISDCIIGESIYKGSIAELVECRGQNTGIPLTIFTRSQDTSPERNEVLGYKFRKVFVSDDPNILDANATYAPITVFIAKPDEEQCDPSIYVEQRVFQCGQEKIVVHELKFKGKVQVEKEYLFKGCGDEDLNLGKRDLRLKIQTLEQHIFNSYMQRASYYGYDIKDCIWLNEHTICSGLAHTVQRCDGLPPYQISFNPEDLEILLDAKLKRPTLTSDASGEGLELLRLRFKGQGKHTEDNGHAGDLFLRVMYKSSS